MGVGDPIRDLPEHWSGQAPAGVRHIHTFSPGCLVVDGPTYGEDPAFAQHLAAASALLAWPLIVLVDSAAKTARSPINFLWTTFTRFEPATDLHPRARGFLRNCPTFSAPLVIDARMKPSYPEELFCDPDTAKTVSRRWKDYFPNGTIEMGDSDRGHLDD